jgi:hypothetical protein
MRRSDIITAGLFLSVTLWGTGFAANASAPAKSLPSVATQADCEKAGSDISALIDASATSPNISAARAVFQVGIMNCMEDEPDKAIYVMKMPGNSWVAIVRRRRFHRRSGDRKI